VDRLSSPTHVHNNHEPLQESNGQSWRWSKWKENEKWGSGGAAHRPKHGSLPSLCTTQSQQPVGAGRKREIEREGARSSSAIATGRDAASVKSRRLGGRVVASLPLPPLPTGLASELHLNLKDPVAADWGRGSRRGPGTAPWECAGDVAGAVACSPCGAMVS
jgi:hypothetical protein